MSSNFSFTVLLATSFLFSCQNDAPKRPEINRADLSGRWEISKAFRNDKQTETLTGTYYEFDEAGTMKTNLTPTTMEQEYKYSFSGHEIKQKGEPTIIYTIDSLTPSFLGMSMSINNFPFKLELNKAVPPAELEANDTSATDSLKEL
ncbi:MAG: hypothetical protein K9J37_01610 [Saprospiraceae bacterium]|nr:hypothetical protein [Saprospiraceae bacterium]MCF8248573.1 hypothetical protein [Saprospiraceae bacterium]MCF8280260.1 hypothetical protein [Bacteroidales bacterium]MCF8310306.1 hypothetical protein [Saprospiraceae bacterium]MCF8439254.1 hypothetical protein [Saprospiraceae bacterium]